MLDISNIKSMQIAEIGSRVRLARKARGLTQAYLAAKAGIARETLSQFEGGASRELGMAKVLRLLRHVGLQLVLVEAGADRTGDPVSLAATAASVGFREPLTAEELIQSLLTGKVPARRGPHLRRLLEDSPPQVVRRIVSQISAWAKPGKVEKNLAALAAKLEVKPRNEWTKPA